MQPSADRMNMASPLADNQKQMGLQPALEVLRARSQIQSPAQLRARAEPAGQSNVASIAKTSHDRAEPRPMMDSAWENLAGELSQAQRQGEPSTQASNQAKSVNNANQPQQQQQQQQLLCGGDEIPSPPYQQAMTVAACHMPSLMNNGPTQEPFLGNSDKAGCEIGVQISPMQCQRDKGPPTDDSAYKLRGRANALRHGEDLHQIKHSHYT
eukprot:scaffold60937_cov21-Prasinocladus_malaysianus.AAC.3